MALDLVDDGLVLKGGAVRGKVDCLRSVRQDIEFTACVIIALFEGEERGSGLALEAEGA